MERNSSTEFIQWNKFLDEEEFYRKKKTDYSLARISWEIRSVMRMFGDKRELPTLEDLIPKFEGTESAPEQPKAPPVIREGDFESGCGQPGIEVGEAELDDKWKVTNAVAKAQWGRLLGVNLNAG